MKRSSKDRDKRGERFNKMSEENKYFWGLVVLWFIAIFLLIKGMVNAFSILFIIIIFYLILKDKVRGLLS